jgi:hypothetical protein
LSFGVYPTDALCRSLWPDPSPQREKATRVGWGNTTQFNHIALKNLKPSPFAFGKFGGFSQRSTTMSAILKMTMQDHKLPSSAHRQGAKTTLKSPLHAQLIPTSPASSKMYALPSSPSRGSKWLRHDTRFSDANSAPNSKRDRGSLSSPRSVSFPFSQ